MPILAPVPQTPVYAGDWTGSINGLSFGPGTPYELVSLGGWRSMQGKPLGGVMTGSAASALPAPKGYTDGSWSIAYYADKREVPMVFAITAGTEDWESTVEAFEAATASTGDGEATLTIQLGGFSTTVTGVIEQREVTTDFEYQFGLAHVPVTFLAFDPRRMAANVSGVTTPPASSGGLTVPFTVPLVIGSTIASGQVVLTNGGNINGPITVKINGPVTGPVVTHQQTGMSIAFSPSFTINAGDWLTLDMEAQTALYNDVASRSSSIVTRGWFPFSPGANVYGFSCNSFGAGASMTVTASPSYL